MRRDLACALVALLGTGGWVCDSADPCVGSLSCSTAVADVCCPPGSPYFCDGECSQTACSGAVPCRYAEQVDDGVCSVASLSATIENATCTRMSGDNVYVVDATGALSGCGTGAALIAANLNTFVSTLVDCGTWQSIGQTSCRPASELTRDTTTWHLNGALTAAAGMPIVLTIVIGIDGLRDPMLASRSVRCE